MYDEIVDFLGVITRLDFFKITIIFIIIFLFFSFFFGGGGGWSFLNILGLFLKVNVHNWTIFWGLLNLKYFGGMPDIRDIVRGKHKPTYQEKNESIPYPPPPPHTHHPLLRICAV